VIRESSYIRLSDLGRAQVKPYQPNTTSTNNIGVSSPSAKMNRIQQNANHEKIQEDIKKKHKLMRRQRGMSFDLLMDGKDHNRAIAAQTIRCTSMASLAVMTSNMKKIGVIEYDKDTIRLSDMCFPLGGEQ
jgi:hypothetical protein